jgi:CRP-like cAMP-binding protein
MENATYVVAGGEVGVLRTRSGGRPVVLLTLGRGDLCDLADGHFGRAEEVALVVISAAALLYRLPRPAFMSLVAPSSDVGGELDRQLASQFCDVTELLLDLAQCDGLARLAHLLGRLARIYGPTIPLTHEAIGHIALMDRGDVTKRLGGLKSRGLIHYQDRRSGIRITDATGLGTIGLTFQ